MRDGEQNLMEFGTREEPRAVREMLGKLPPPRKAVEKKLASGERPPSPGDDFVWIEDLKQWRHFVFERVRLYPPARPSRPPKPWPARCFAFFWLKFDSEKEARSWIESASGSVYASWRCRMCGKWHAESYPHEVTGTTSGKSLRKAYFLIHNKGKSPEEVYGITTPEK